MLAIVRIGNLSWSSVSPKILRYRLGPTLSKAAATIEASSVAVPAALSQFKAGNTYGAISTNSAIRQEDVLFVKKEDPRVNIFQGDFATQAGFVQNFGWQPEGRSPFVDERVRQAVSMAIDRDLFIDTVSNVAPFRSEGLPVETRWN